MKKILFCFAFIILCASLSLAAQFDGLGEAEIISGDIPSAKIIATSRAKWAALEKASGIKVKVDTIMNNAVLADEAVKSELSGTIKSFKITDEGKDGNNYWVTINADIVPDMAKKTLNNFQKTTTVLVYIPATLPNGKVEEKQALSNAIIKELQRKDFDVVAYDKDSAKLIEKAMKSGRYQDLNAVGDSLMAPNILVGSLKIIEKSNDIGYGKADFALVNGELEWQLIGDKDGKKSVVASGTYSERGQGMTANDAAYNVFKNMADDAAIRVASDVAQNILGENAKTIKISLKGERDERLFKELRDDIKDTPFVLDVREQGLDSVLADYPDKTYYLATFLTRNNKYSVVKLSEQEIILERR